MEIGNIKPIKIDDEMRSSYLDYAMSVIVSRALPDVRDGLKPVQRRILYAMDELGLRYNGPYKKSARIVGEVLGKYHPHGDTSVYDAMVRMAQDFSMRYPLVDGQGNFGSMDNDPPAAMRYTEARQSQIAQEMLADIGKETVDFAPNFDGSLQEPTVLPARLPNLLVNGTAGIAVGMATSIPPHNLGEICDGITCLIDNPESTVADLSRFIHGPDFPTAGIILGRDGIHSAYNTGHGRIVVRAKAYFEEVTKGRYQVVVTELPYQTNKAALLERIAHLARDKRIEGIAEVRDESDRQGMRIIVEVRKDAQPDQVLNNLYKHTAMKSAFFVNMLALVDGQPRVLSLKQMLQHYIDFRQQVISRRSRFDLNRAEERAHIVEGLRIALDNLDRVIATIRKAETVELARDALMSDFNLSQVQAQAILDMQLRRLAALERKKIDDEYEELVRTIAYLQDLLANPRKIMSVVKDEVLALKAKYSDARRTQISEQEDRPYSEDELIPHQQVVVTLSTRGYIKRLPIETYRLQRRGGKGVIGVVTKETEAVLQVTVADTHDYLFFFTNRGKVYRLRCHEIPGDSSRTTKGLPIVNLIAMDIQERVTALVKVSDLGADASMIMATRLGEVKRTALEEFSLVRSNGLIATDLEPGDELVAAQLAGDRDDLIMVSHGAQSIRFPVLQLRSASRTSGGVRGLKLEPGDRLVAMDVVDPEGLLLVVSERGIGKLTPLCDYPSHHRGGGGVRTLRVTEKTGGVAAVLVAHPSHELMIASSEGILIRTPVEKISTQGRDTQGVMLMRLDEGDRVVSCACLDTSDIASGSSDKQGPDAP